MKKQSKIHLFFFFILFFLSTSCSLKNNVCKDGKGEIINQERSISAFTAIESRGNFTINLFQDSSIKEQSVIISAQENIIELIQTEIFGQSLIINNNECYNTDEEIRITIQTPALSQIVLNGSGNIILQDTVRNNEIEFVLDGSGKIQTTPDFPIIATTKCITRVKGSGNIDLDFKATSIINASVDGSGSIILRGKALENNLSINGSGTIKAFALPILKNTSEIIGSGIIELTAVDTINTI